MKHVLGRLVGVAIVSMLIMFVAPAYVSAITWGGDMTGSVSWDTGIFATGEWEDSSTTFSWDISQEDGVYTYRYTWSTAAKDLSHIILEISEDATLADFDDFSPLPSEDSPKFFSGDDPSNPGMPLAWGEIWGIKWDTTTDTTYFEFGFTSTRVPMEGRFYAKDGKTGTGQSKIDVIAYSKVAVPVPDTVSVPEPATLLLLGSGLAALGLLGRKRSKKT